ncbi:hypothetical protein BDV30DRAFT_108244 [Aspergillus minisclerotigenes]|uniref:Uncharacterized protein n=1 Tax=Aspergillus minisclerotigenes TaxID=656917 RepID=A0A5N6J3Q1_9EURO|nr:hypothetical protein BDV30DRAFT_108244 [Aspergillus minisclerotigenes]
MDMGCRTYMRVALCSPLQPISYHYQLQGGRTCSSARIRNLATTVIFASLLVGGERASPGCTSSRTTKQAHAILGIQTTWYHIPLYFCRLGREWVVPSTPRGRRVSKSRNGDRLVSGVKVCKTISSLTQIMRRKSNYNYSQERRAEPRVWK